MFCFENESYERERFENVVCCDDLEDKSFYKCVFVNSSFQSQRLIDCVFDDCEFIQCNLSVVELVRSVFSGVKFEDCKLIGINWASVSGLFSASFGGCNLSDNLFIDMNLSKQKFSSCLLSNSIFSKTKLRQAVFDDCDLAGCQFDQTDLGRANFVTSRNCYMDANDNNLREAVFSLPEVVSLLDNLEIVIE